MKSNKFIVVILLIACSIFIMSCSGEGGVRLSNEMEAYALKYLKETKILNPGEKISAYYDMTIVLDGTEAAILTNKRLIYHTKNYNTIFNLKDIVEIKHRKESFIGDIIEVYKRNGEIMKVEVAPMNQGKTFLNVLKKLCPRAKK